MKPVRVGVIGCGVIGPTHVEAAVGRGEVKVVAVADLIVERARSVAERFSVPAFYDSGDKLLKDPNVEAVVLAMPVVDRTPLAYKALKRGKHVLLQKPVAAKAADVRKMMALQGKLTVGCCSPAFAFTGHTQAAAKCVASGALGKIRVARFRAIQSVGSAPSDNPPPWRQSMKLNGGGILVNWSCYDVDYMMHILNWQVRPRTIMAKWWPVAEKMSKYVALGSDADSHFIALIRCDDDVVLSMERAEFTPTTTDQAWEIIGTDGALHLPMRPQVGKPNAVILDRFVPGQGVVAEMIWKEGDAEPGGNATLDFARAIREGREPATDLERALIMQKITDAIYKSSATGKSVTL